MTLLPSTNMTVSWYTVPDKMLLPKPALYKLWINKPIPVGRAVREWICAFSLPGIAGSNPAEGSDICLLWIVFVVRYRSLQRADSSSRGVLSTVCLSVSVIRYQTIPLHVQWLGRTGPTKKGRKELIKLDTHVEQNPSLNFSNMHTIAL